MFIFKRIALVILVALTIKAHADESGPIRIKDGRCSVAQFNKKRARFVPTKRRLSSFAKRSLIGKELEKAEGKTAFYVDGDKRKQLYAVLTSCVVSATPAKVATPTSAPTASAPTRAARFSDPRAPFKEGKYYLTLAFLTWQEGIQVKRSANDPGGAITWELLVTAMSICPGVGVYLYEKSSFKIGWDTCAPFANSELGLKDGVSETDNYSGKNVKIFGLMTGPTFLYTFAPSLGIGLDFPIMYRYGMWRDPQVENWSISKKNAFFPIYLFSAHWRSERWSFVQKIGVLKKWPGYFWGLQANYKF